MTATATMSDTRSESSTGLLTEPAADSRTDLAVALAEPAPATPRANSPRRGTGVRSLKTSTVVAAAERASAGDSTAGTLAASPADSSAGGITVSAGPAGNASAPKSAPAAPATGDVLAVAPAKQGPDVWAEFLASAKPAPTPADYEQHLAAHELDMTAALSLKDFGEFLCRPKINVTPFRHQIEAAISYFKHLAPRGLIADDVGLGKTVIAGLIAAELMARGRARSLLIVAPRPLVDQWKAELASKFGIQAEAAVGAEFDRIRNAPCIVTTYQTAAARIDKLAERRFDLLIMDEAHKLRSLNGPGTGSTMAQAFHKFMMNRGATFVLMLTATPLQNKLWDIHSLMEILSAPQPNPLGGEEEFAARFIADGKGAARKLTEEAADEFRRRVGCFISRRRRVDVGLMFPRRLVLDRKEAPNLDEQLYLDDCLALLGSLKVSPMEQCTFARSVLSSPAAAASSLRKMKWNMEPEFHPKADELIARGEAAAERPTTKGKALVELINNLRREDPNWRCIVFTQRRATLRNICRTLAECGLGDVTCTFQGADADVNRQSIADFTADPPRKRIFVATDAGAEGLNLQCCSVLINYDLPWNPMCVEQRIGRVQRLGQKAAAVVINNLVLRDTLEEKVVLRLWEKLDLFKSAVGEMEEVLSLAGETETENFELDILRLIRKTLAKQDTDKEIELKQRSLEEAREKFGEMRAATEEALGRVDPGESDGEGPDLERTPPRRSLTEFASAALKARGRDVRPDGANRLRVGGPKAEPVVYTFNVADPELTAGASAVALSAGTGGSGGPSAAPGTAVTADGTALRLLAPGTRDLTELVDDWKAQCHVLALNGVSRARSAESVAVSWFAERGNQVRRVKVVRRATRMCAELAVVARAWVHHDRWEGVVEVPIRYAEDGVGFELEASLPPAALSPAALGEAWWKHARNAAEREVNRPEGPVKRFSAWYLRRRTELQLRLLRQVAGRIKVEVTDHSTTETLLEKLAPRFGVELSDRGSGDVEHLVRQLEDYKPMYGAAAADIDIKTLPKTEVRPVGLRAILYERVTVEVESVDGTTVTADVVPLTGRVFVKPSEEAGSRQQAAGTLPRP